MTGSRSFWRLSWTATRTPKGEGGLAIPDRLAAVAAALVGRHPVVGIQPVKGPLPLADGIPGELGVGVGELVGEASVVMAVAGVQVAAEAAGDLVDGPLLEPSSRSRSRGLSST
jgi:hypothetical protein